MSLPLKRFASIFFTLFLLCNVAYAQSEDDKNWLTIAYNNNQYGSIIRLPVDNILSFNAPSVSISLERYLNQSFNLSVTASLGEIHDEFDNKRANLFGLHVVPKFKLNNGRIFKEDAKIAPYVAFGLGFMSFGEVTNPIDEEGLSINIKPTAGIDWRLSEKFKLFAATSYNITGNINYREYSLGVGFSIKRKKDSDNDGITDNKDECPNEFGPEDNNGCPYPDRDGDGIIDRLDECPDSAGKLASGCPDTDGDGIADAQDKCPNVAGKNGRDCPLDSDGDGIADEQDKCPNQAGTFEGCPDDPDAPSVIDTDQDGIPDAEDDCPADKGDLENQGCPVYTPTLPVEVITFRWNSTDLLPVYIKALDEVAALMQEYNFSLEIRGHSDNTGDADYNMYLSKLRASVVLEYLADKGIPRTRLKSEGFGINEPISTNSSRVGRAMNRRVEIKITKK